MSYSDFITYLENLIIALDEDEKAVYYTANYNEFSSVISNKLNEDAIIFINEISDLNNTINLLDGGGIKNTFSFRIYVLFKHKDTATESDLNTQYANAVFYSNQLFLSLNNHLGKNYQISNARLRRVKMISPNLFAGGLMTFDVTLRGVC